MPMSDDDLLDSPAVDSMSQHDMEGADETTGESGSRHGLPVAFWLFVLIFILYPLSIAPVSFLAMQIVGEASWVQSVFVVVYFPVIRLYEESEFFEVLLNWYFSLWIKD